MSANSSATPTFPKVKYKYVANYKLGKTIGKGKYSKVKFGVHVETKHHVAVKIIKQEYLNSMEKQIMREITIMKLVKHPYIVECKEVFRTESNVYMVMELVTGGELFEHIGLLHTMILSCSDFLLEAVKLDENTARRYFQQIILALEYCHSQGIAHRDLKLENLLLDENNNIKITDFGLSSFTSFTSSSVLKTICGTPNYVSPEVLQDKGYDGFKSDIWSCGVILFVMICGFLPFEDVNLTKLFAKICSGKVTYPKTVNKDGKDLISHCLEVNPEKRISIDKIKQHKWFKQDFQKITTSLHSKIELLSVKHLSIESLSVYHTEHNGNDDEKVETAITAFDIVAACFAGNMAKLMKSDGVIKRSGNRWLLKGDFSLLKKTIVECLSQIEANPAIKANEPNELFIKCIINTNQDKIKLLTFTVELTNTICSGISLLELNRSRGSGVTFNSVIKELVALLNEYLCGGT